MARFETIMETVFKWEGGYVDNPFDNGGPTNMGITHNVLARWRGVAGVTRAEVRNLTKAEATEIFRSRYWDRIQGPSLPAPIDLIVMDGAVNHGVTAMSKMLQRCVGVADDGDIGYQTLEAVATQTNSSENTFDLAVKLAEARKSRYVNHEDARHFLRGWRNRLNDVMATALEGESASWSFSGGRAPATPGRPPGDDGPSNGSMIRPVIEDVDLQVFLTVVELYNGDLDGLFGPASVGAMNQYLGRRSTDISGDWSSWSISRRKIALGQFLCRDTDIDAGRIDGLFGPQTQYAFEEFNRVKLRLPNDGWRDLIDELPPPSAVNTVWPREQEIQSFQSIFGPLGNECRLVPTKRLELPFRMKLAWELSTELDGFYIHEQVHDSAARVFERVYAEYKDDGVEDLGVNLFGGCKNCRRKRGGSNWSMHAWSIAIDFDPARNRLSWSHTRARLARPDAVRFWEFWEAEGWVSLGRSRDFDWMHVQAARL